MEAQQAGNRQQAVVALKQLLDTLDHNDSKQIHLPALLRCVISTSTYVNSTDPHSCTTRLLASNLEDETHELETPEYLCQIFEKGLPQDHLNYDIELMKYSGDTGDGRTLLVQGKDFLHDRARVVFT